MQAIGLMLQVAAVQRAQARLQDLLAAMRHDQAVLAQVQVSLA